VAVAAEDTPAVLVRQDEEEVRGFHHAPFWSLRGR
jgi:hypothetical protein